MRADSEIAKQNFPILVHEDVACLDVSMNLTLVVQVEHALERLLEDGGDHRLVLDAVRVPQLDDVDDGAGAEQGHDHPEVGVVHEGDVVAAQVLVQARRHNVNLFSDVRQVAILEVLQVYDLDRHVFADVH